MYQLKDKVVVLTGASSGIGEELALQLSREGAHLVLAARRQEELDRVAAACQQQGVRTFTVPTDVTSEDACAVLMDAAVKEFGRIDVLVNNAGISMWTRFDEVKDLQPMRSIMEVNYYGSVYCTAHALPHLKKSKGMIVGVASLTGITGVPTRTFYAASKHAMMGFFDSLRVELMDTGVTVSMICPSFVATKISRFDSDGGKASNDLVDNNKIMKVEVCCAQIVHAMKTRKRQVTMTSKGKIGRWLKLLAPGIIDKITRNAIERGH